MNKHMNNEGAGRVQFTEHRSFCVHVCLRGDTRRERDAHHLSGLLKRLHALSHTKAEADWRPVSVMCENDASQQRQVQKIFSKALSTTGPTTGATRSVPPTVSALRNSLGDTASVVLIRLRADE
ncbi:hypothetical protein NDU88_004704 [Pleurodeles waltl]|uniref:Uncharacterized protein n=1 Tax=Pleurodeles waltl TaxID=8319 RepID=A0AAV7VGZ2_PLEWA|nr:hypothetical protein NDU88_004704 [Pleurodeles waltl]